MSQEPEYEDDIDQEPCSLCERKECICDEIYENHKARQLEARDNV